MTTTVTVPCRVCAGSNERRGSAQRTEETCVLRVEHSWDYREVYGVDVVQPCGCDGDPAPVFDDLLLLDAVRDWNEANYDGAPQYVEEASDPTDAPFYTGMLHNAGRW